MIIKVLQFSAMISKIETYPNPEATMPDLSSQKLRPAIDTLEEVAESREEELNNYPSSLIREASKYENDSDSLIIDNFTTTAVLRMHSNERETLICLNSDSYGSTCEGLRRKIGMLGEVNVPITPQTARYL